MTTEIATLFRKAVRTQSKAKIGFFGSEGTGKTITATLLAVALNHFIKSKKPIAFFDTETGSDFALELVDRAGMEMVTIKSRALSDLGKAFKEVALIADVFIIDSLTHPYKELIETYQEKNRQKWGKRFITIRDWGIIKPIWAKEFSGPYVNSPVHCIWCARSKNLFEEVEDPEGGENQTKMVSLGTGVRSETESAYEPSLLVEMTKEYTGDGGRYLRKATVVKDRSMRIDSHEFTFDPADLEKILKGGQDSKKYLLDNPVFKAFYPHIEYLSLSQGAHVGFDETRKSSELIDDTAPADNVVAYRKRQEIAWEKVENGLSVVFTNSTKDKAMKYGFMEVVLGTSSEKEACQKHPDLLEKAHLILNQLADAITQGKTFENLGAFKTHIRHMVEEFKQEKLVK